MNVIDPWPSLSAMHRATCRRLGPKTALRYRRHGLYRNIAWNTYRRLADRAAAGLIELGVQAGDRVAILSENRWEWLIADHAILSTGAADVPLHSPLSAKQVEFQIGHSEARGMIVSGQTQADKVIAVMDNLPRLEFLIAFEPIDVLQALPVLTWEGLIARGSRADEAVHRERQRREAELSPETLATIIYTSGTTGNPKGVMLTHGNLVSNAAATRAASPIHPEDVVLSWLPYSHIYARTVDHYLTTLSGTVLCLAESVETLIDDLADIQPTWMASVPRFYEKVWASVEQLSAQERRERLLEMFPRIRHLSSGGAPLPPHVCRGFQEAGIPLLEGYGLTESSPVISFNQMESHRLGTVGHPVPGVEVRIADDGEILTRGPHVMKGYWKNPAATAEAITDGWLHTGDVGRIDEDGFLAITDRKKDLFVTSAGKNVAPAVLERLLVADPFIEQAVIYGDGRKFISALIVPNAEKLQELVDQSGCELTIENELIQNREILDIYSQRISAIMQSVSRPEQVKRFLLLARSFQLDADELTATLKVRRGYVIEKYEDRLAAFYDEMTAGRAEIRQYPGGSI